MKAYPWVTPNLRDAILHLADVKVMGENAEEMFAAIMGVVSAAGMMPEVAATGPIAGPVTEMAEREKHGSISHGDFAAEVAAVTDDPELPNILTAPFEEIWADEMAVLAAKVTDEEPEGEAG